MIGKKLKELAGHSFLYSLSFIFGSAASIILLPIYTRYLGKADYGVLEILAYTNDILRLIMAAGLNNALAKFYHDSSDDKTRQTIISSATLFILLSALSVSVISYYADARLAVVLLGSADYAKYIDVNILVLLGEIMVTISGTYFVVAKQPGIFVKYNFLRLILGVSSSVYFLVFLELGAMGMLYGQLFSNGIIAIFLTVHVLWLNKIHWDFSLLKRLLKFSTPIVPALLCATLMHNADRFLIRIYGSLDDVGLYSLGYKFPFMLNALILASFNRIWTGSAIYEISKEPDSSFQYARITTYFMTLFVFAMFALSVSSAAIVRILAAPKFFEAYRVIPLVALGLCFHAFYTFFTIGAYLKSKTWLLNVSYVPAALINITANIYFLPRYGYMAAAWVTVLTYAVFALAAYVSCKDTIRISYETKRLISVFFLAIFIYLLSSSVNMGNLLMEIIVDCFFIALFPLFLLLTGWLSEGEKIILKNKIAVWLPVGKF